MLGRVNQSKRIRLVVGGYFKLRLSWGDYYGGEKSQEGFFGRVSIFRQMGGVIWFRQGQVSEL